MKISYMKKVEAEVMYLFVDAGVRFWEDSTVDGVEDEKGDLIPCRVGERWRPIINLNSGIIENWQQGKTAQIHYKVCDDGIYSLQDHTGETIFQKDGYVPDLLCPTESGYGDYIIMNVDANGKIEKFDADLDDIIGSED